VGNTPVAVVRCRVPDSAAGRVALYTSRHEHDARWWRERFVSAAGREAREGLSVLRREVAERAAKPLPAFLSLWTSPAAGSHDTAAECLNGVVAAVADPELLAAAMRETSPHWNEDDDQLFRSIRPALLAVLEEMRAAAPCFAAVSTPRTAATPISSPVRFLTGAPGLAILRLVTSN
jgi:hypothetical protein